ncbi:MAG: T9SS type A sorting domain-containing protein [Bacteroidetes bacterium]|nr:T9SS type A sorting domain-containing protein [Bacteroidota bacterium]
MKKKLQLLFAVAVFATQLMFAQQRFLNPVFSGVTKTSNVQYSTNLSVLTGTPSAVSLLMDVYEPTGDTMSKRPVVIVLHTGSFLPRYINRQATGDKTDSAVVETCNRFAKMGYVACAVAYRTGWNPTALGSAGQDVRTGTLLNAVYRAIQDVKSSVRFLKKEQMGANLYRTDSTKIAVMGYGSGGYVSYAAATLNKYSEIVLGKFISGTTSQPYIDTTLSGNFDGTLARPLCLPTNLGHTSNYAAAVAIGGAAGDSSWMEAGDVPFIGMQCTKDPNAPYNFGQVIVPTTGDFVVDASGSGDMIRISNQLGNNTSLNSAPTNVYTTKAASMNGGVKGLYPFFTAPIPAASALTCGTPIAAGEEGGPWDWWNESAYIAGYTPYAAGGAIEATVTNCVLKYGSPGWGATKGRLYIDTIVGFTSANLFAALSLPTVFVGVNEVELAKNVNLYPNPANTNVTIASIDNTVINTVVVMDVTGKTIVSASVNANNYTINYNSLSKGVYVVKVQFANGKEANKKLIVE